MLRMKNISDEVVEKMNIHFMFNRVFTKIALFMR